MAADPKREALASWARLLLEELQGVACSQEERAAVGQIQELVGSILPLGGPRQLRPVAATAAVDDETDDAEARAKLQGLHKTLVEPDAKRRKDMRRGSVDVVELPSHLSTESASARSEDKSRRSDREHEGFTSEAKAVMLKAGAGERTPPAPLQVQLSSRDPAATLAAAAAIMQGPYRPQPLSRARSTRLPAILPPPPLPMSRSPSEAALARGRCGRVRLGALVAAAVVARGLAAATRPLRRLRRRSDTESPRFSLMRRRQTAALALMHNSEPPSRYIFLPGSPVIRLWEYGILLAILWVVVTAPLRLGFSLWGDAWLPFDVVVDLMFAMDIAISCNTAFQDPDNDRIVANRGVIARRYLSGGAFVIDFVSAFPFYAVSNSRTARVLLLLKPLRLTRVSFITSRSSRLGASTRLRQVTNLAVFAVIIHCIACSYWWIASGAAADVDAASAWMPREEWGWMYERYADALHWTLTSTLKSGPDPETYGQYVFTCVVILIGEILKAYLIGSITEILTTLNLAEAEKKAQLDNVTTFLSRRRVDADLRRRILEFFDYRWSVGYSVKEHEVLLKQLPAQLSLELSLELKRTLIDKVPMFANLKPDTVVQLAESLHATLAVPDELIVVQGVLGNGLYYVNRGIVRVEFTPGTKGDSGNVIEVMTTGVGSSFGEDSLVTRQPRLATVRALTFCDLQRLSYRAYKRITESSTDFKLAVERAHREKAAIVAALSRSTRMLQKMASDGPGAGSSAHNGGRDSGGRQRGRFTRIAAEAMATAKAFRSPDASMRDAYSGGRFAAPARRGPAGRSNLRRQASEWRPGSIREAPGES